MKSVLLKIFGVLFYAIAILLTLALLTQIDQIIIDFLDIIKIFFGDLSAYEVGVISGKIFTSISIFVIIILSFLFGRFLFRKSKNVKTQLSKSKTNEINPL